MGMIIESRSRQQAIQEYVARVVELDPKHPIQDDLSELYTAVEQDRELSPEQIRLLHNVVLGILPE